MIDKVKSSTETQGIRIDAVAQYIPEESNPEQYQYVFVYKIRITNEGSEQARLDSRYWKIINSNGDEKEVSGPGVVGYYPDLEPGQDFEYTSWSPLDTEWGTMEGYFTFHRKDGSEFNASINRFYLTSTANKTLECL